MRERCRVPGVLQLPQHLVVGENLSRQRNPQSLSIYAHPWSILPIAAQGLGLNATSLATGPDKPREPCPDPERRGSTSQPALALMASRNPSGSLATCERRLRSRFRELMLAAATVEAVPKRSPDQSWIPAGRPIAVGGAHP